MTIKLLILSKVFYMLYFNYNVFIYYLYSTRFIKSNTCLEIYFSKNHELKTRNKYNFLSFILGSTMPNCCVVGCGYDLAPKDGTYESYRLPKDPKISQKWLKLINRANYVPSSSTAVCHRHFEEDAFLSHEQNITKKGKQRKRRNL